MDIQSIGDQVLVKVSNTSDQYAAIADGEIKVSRYKAGYLEE